MSRPTALFSRTLLLLAIFCLSSGAAWAQRVEGPAHGPRYAVDPFRPKPLPNNWLLGQVAGIAAASDDTIWLLHRPATLTDDERGARIGSFGRPGRQAGDLHWVHNVAIDSQGSVYTSEVDTGKRAQRFVRVP